MGALRADVHLRVRWPRSGLAKAGSEIAGFSLDMSAPMAPFSIAGFKSDGPAQQDPSGELR